MFKRWFYDKETPSTPARSQAPRPPSAYSLVSTVDSSSDAKRVTAGGASPPCLARSPAAVDALLDALHAPPAAMDFSALSGSVLRSLRDAAHHWAFMLHDIARLERGARRHIDFGNHVRIVQREIELRFAGGPESALLLSKLRAVLAASDESLAELFYNDARTTLDRMCTSDALRFSLLLAAYTSTAERCEWALMLVNAQRASGSPQESLAAEAELRGDAAAVPPPAAAARATDAAPALMSAASDSVPAPKEAMHRVGPGEGALQTLPCDAAAVRRESKAADSAPQFELETKMTAPTAAESVSAPASASALLRIDDLRKECVRIGLQHRPLRMGHGTDSARLLEVQRLWPGRVICVLRTQTRRADELWAMEQLGFGLTLFQERMRELKRQGLEGPGFVYLVLADAVELPKPAFKSSLFSESVVPSAAAPRAAQPAVRP